MSVATASKQAYGRMSSVAPKEHPVYKLLKTFGPGSAGYSNRQIAAIMKRPINTITPRVFELRQAGVVVLAGKRKDVYSGIEVSHWRIASEAEEAAFRGLPRTFDSLLDVPAGVVVRETEAGWLWAHDGHGKTRMSSSEGKEWSTWDSFRSGEDRYGPFTEVL